tara:strand:+ start:1352 stop:1960 length:609 start_codon:yes stop_codon:yes gene_type:complete
MASNKFYGYYLRGSQIALIEEDLDDNGKWKSPIESVTDGLEVEYAYSPRYRINDADDTLAVTAYTESSGLLSLTIASCSFTAGDPIVINGSEKWNGLHYVNATVSGATTLILKTKYNGGSVTESFNVLQDIDTLDDEDDEIDLPEYLAKALVYYVKAKVAEDRMDIEGKEYFMAEYRKMVEKQESSKVWGLRQVHPAPNAIK